MSNRKDKDQQRILADEAAEMERRRQERNERIRQRQEEDDKRGTD
jgi:hypothetical protein